MRRRFTLLFLLIVIPACPCFGTQSGCYESTVSWTTVDDLEARDILQRHVQSKCLFAGNWVNAYSEVAEDGKRKRMCDDLVLIWTHKECNYFRDYITPDVFEPCKQWTREMFRHCMANDGSWFPEK